MSGELTDAGVESILNDFRAWLTQLPATPPEAPTGESVDLATLVRQFTALRQDVNLQTRASRAQLEQNAKALETLAAAVDAAREPAVDPEALLRPLFKSLIDVRDALSLAQKHVAKSAEALAPAPPPPSVSLTLPVWARWLGLEARVRDACAPLENWAKFRADLEHRRSLIDSLVVGYQMSMQRLDRTLEQHGLERIDCVGEPFDPEIMEVVEVIKDDSRTTSEVLEDVRPGYRLRGQLFRCAQVRVARP